ncbi:three-helix bundle dimerization domain-containing protein [Corynebacterium mayonis]|uniref:three-helix bundle dimerization domain-containing protein n=1 Tax=Corynebacterium mayonis TaxID=3062461 RepID=UPI003140540D
MKNNIDFSIIRERALRNIRKDLINDWSDRYEAAHINDVFDNVLANHRAEAVIEDFVPVLVEAEMLNRLRDGEMEQAH